MGSTRLVMDGTAVERHDFEPYGAELSGGWRTPALGYGSATLRQRFTGQERDDDTTLDYFLARYYSGTQGRFGSPDPGNAGANAGDPQSWNGYAYVSGNPLTYTDPSGLQAGGGGDMAGGGGGDSGIAGAIVTAFADALGFLIGGGGSHPNLSNIAWTPGPTWSVDVFAQSPQTMTPPNVYGIPGLIFFAQGTGSMPKKGAVKAPNNFTKHYGLTTPCGSTASQVMGAVESNFAQFGNYSRYGGAESVSFSPPAGMGVGSTIPINVGILGFNQSLSVNVAAMNSQSMTFTTNPGHLIYPGFVKNARILVRCATISGAMEKEGLARTVLLHGRNEGGFRHATDAHGQFAVPHHGPTHR
jgi:RHS repeat-associated protein